MNTSFGFNRGDGYVTLIWGRSFICVLTSKERQQHFCSLERYNNWPNARPVYVSLFPNNRILWNHETINYVGQVSHDKLLLPVKKQFWTTSFYIISLSLTLYLSLSLSAFSVFYIICSIGFENHGLCRSVVQTEFMLSGNPLKWISRYNSWADVVNSRHLFSSKLVPL